MDWSVFPFVIMRIGGRYLIFAGALFLIFYVWKGRSWEYKKIQNKFPKNSEYLREFFYSALTISMFAVMGALLLYHPNIRPFTTLYPHISDRSWFYYFGLFPALFVVHDAYFYLIHRLMHTPFLYKHVHKVHHRSTNPSPWAAYSFHPFEALLEFGILPLFLFTIPVHWTHILLFFLAMIGYNVYGHLGFELYPRGFSDSKWGRWVNTSVNHNQHHQYFTGNYSLYFLFWDRLLGTLRKDYSEKYEEVCSRRDRLGDMRMKERVSGPPNVSKSLNTNNA